MIWNLYWNILWIGRFSFCGHFENHMCLDQDGIKFRQNRSRGLRSRPRGNSERWPDSAVNVLLVRPEVGATNTKIDYNWCEQDGGLCAYYQQIAANMIPESFPSFWMCNLWPFKNVEHEFMMGILMDLGAQLIQPRSASGYVVFPNPWVIEKDFCPSRRQWGDIQSESSDSW